MIDGRCFCGFIRYDADGPLSDQTNCHCSICRRTSGAPFVAWVTVPKQGFRFLTGEPASFRSSEKGVRTFCPRCGTPLTFTPEEGSAEVDITICSLDRPEAVSPRDHTWVSSKVSWLHLDDDLPRFPKARSS